MTFTAAEDLKTLLGENIIGGLEVTDETILDISWLEGLVFDVSGDQPVAVQANTGTTLTDATTNYLFWSDSTPTILTVKLTVPSGNEVLVATIVTLGGDITSITEHGFDFSSVSGLDGRPVIRLVGDNLPDFGRTYGQILIGDENLNRNDYFAGYRSEFYRILVTLEYDGGIGPSLLKRIMAQMDTVFNTNNNGSSPSYFYEILYTWKGLYTLGSIDVFIEATKQKVSVI